MSRNKLPSYWLARLVLNAIAMGVLTGLGLLFGFPRTFGIVISTYIVYAILSFGDAIIDEMFDC